MCSGLEHQPMKLKVPEMPKGHAIRERTLTEG